MNMVAAKLRIAGVLPCSFVNGEGARYVVFTQGCGHHCPGCQNPDTWDFSGGSEVSVEWLAADFKKHRLLDGITLSGGDPFFQQEACVELLKLLPGVNVWIYTGFEYDDIRDTQLAQMADAVVTGKFIQELACEGKMYGSSNQKIIRKDNHHVKD
jgi:anaerobic ribonucleoside-triphosphate reductase activating protein